MIFITGGGAYLEFMELPTTTNDKIELDFCCFGVGFMECFSISYNVAILKEWCWFLLYFTLFYVVI